MVQRGVEKTGDTVQKTICHTIRAERECFRGFQRRRTGGALGPTRGLAFLRGPEGIHEERQGVFTLSVAGGDETA